MTPKSQLQFANILELIIVCKKQTAFHRTNVFFCIHPPPELLPVLGPLERYMTPTLDVALLISSRAGADLGQTSVTI